MATTPRDELADERTRAVLESKRCRRLLRSLPDELLDLEVDDFIQYVTFEEQNITLHKSELTPGLLSLLLSISIEDEVEAKKTWRTGVKTFAFTLHDGTPVELTTSSPECKRYKVMDIVQKPHVITVCGTPDPAQYIVVDVVN